MVNKINFVVDVTVINVKILSLISRIPIIKAENLEFQLYASVIYKYNNPFLSKSI